MDLVRKGTTARGVRTVRIHRAQAYGFGSNEDRARWRGSLSAIEKFVAVCRFSEQCLQSRVTLMVAPTSTH